MAERAISCGKPDTNKRAGRGLFLRLCLRRSLLRTSGGLGGEVEDLATVVPSAIHADDMTLVRLATVTTLRHARPGKSVVGAAVIAVGARCAHSVYHGDSIT